MSKSPQKPPGAGGGSIAARGFLVQTLASLLDIAQANPPFTEITLEPAIGNEQFDYVWKDAKGTHAVQVKSTAGTFKKPDVETWAAKLQAARQTEDCRLLLVGLIHPSLEKIQRIGDVALEKKNFNLTDLLEQAAHRLGKFLETEEMNPGTSVERERTVHALVSKLEHLSAKSETLSRDAFVKLLRLWVSEARAQELPIYIDHIACHAPEELIGREAELTLLDDAWAKVISGETRRPRVLTFVALGGEGKTSLVAKWAAELAYQDWPACDAAFAWSFYNQGTREQSAASSDLFLKEALNFFGDAEMAASAYSAFEKGRRLAQLVGGRRALLILDGLEPLQYPPTSPTPGELKDHGLSALLTGLAANSHGLCVVTTRYSIPDLRAYWQTTAPEVKLTHLSQAAGVALLRSLGVRGTPREFETLVEDVQGHALTLNLLGSYLRDAHAGDIRKRDLVKLEEADAEEQGGHAFRVMDAYVKWFESDGENGQRTIALLRLLGLFDRAATTDCVAALLKAPGIPDLTGSLVGMTEAKGNLTLSRLQGAKLITASRDSVGTLLSLDAHPLLREYFAQQLRTQQPDAWRTAHRRLYEHLCKTTSDSKPEPTLEDLQPLYQAVAHGCQAGLQQETCEKVYKGRILRGTRHDGFYSTRKLGAFGSDLGAVACFFDEPWTRVSSALTEANQAFLLNAAPYRLRALGRLTEALEPMREVTEMTARLGDWKNAAVDYINLSELELSLGDVAAGIEDATQALSYADQSGDTFWKLATLATHANALHQAGRPDDALALFRQAEQLQQEWQPEYPILNALEGFRYCDLLLAAPERGVWQLLLNPQPATRNPRLAESCRSVSQRAAQTLKWCEQPGLPLDVALDHLTLGRAALFEFNLDPSNAALRVPRSELDSAVDDLHRAGDMTRLPLGLLTRAWLRFLFGPRTGPESSQTDLEEAWDVAERGPMRLHMADIHLYRARLFFREKHYSWKSPADDLAAAEKLINECGYHRRDEELADAKRVILGKQ